MDVVRGGCGGEVLVVRRWLLLFSRCLHWQRACHHCHPSAALSPTPFTSLAVSSVQRETRTHTAAHSLT